MLLQGLTQVEEMLVAAVMPIMSIYRLPHGQYGYTGHVINLPQDVMSFAHRLPRLPSDLDVVVVRKEGADQSHRDKTSKTERLNSRENQRNRDLKTVRKREARR